MLTLAHHAIQRALPEAGDKAVAYLVRVIGISVQFPPQNPVLEYGSDNYGFSEQRMLVYVPGGVEAVSKGNLVWVSRDGKEEPIEAPPEVYSFPRISPDGRLIAVTEETSGNSGIWIWDLFRKTMTRLTFDEGEDSYPVWSPDGKRFLMIKESTIDTSTEGTSRPRINIVLNWFEELNEQVPTD